MKTTNKKAYMIPETEFLSLEPISNLLNSSKFGFDNANGGEGNFHAPKRESDVF